uniref:Secreted protein n=1 Tax=Knipowitschia caucasica TaxID=637954 RepID=A0AAV2KPG2_KNICA
MAPPHRPVAGACVPVLVVSVSASPRALRFAVSSVQQNHKHGLTSATHAALHSREKNAMVFVEDDEGRGRSLQNLKCL